MTDNVIPFAVSERIERDAVALLRRLADEVECAKGTHLVDLLQRLPLAALQREADLVVRR